MSHSGYCCLMTVDREQVLRTAAALLSRKATATMDEVAKSAGIGRATLHRHFAGREALVKALEGLGIRFVASPRHADMLLVTGPVSRHMEIALKRTYDATPEPKLVVALGDCGCTGGIFGESYASCGRVSNVIPLCCVTRAVGSGWMTVTWRRSGSTVATFTPAPSVT